MATRQEWDNKIKFLNEKHVKSGKELNAVLKEFVEVSFDQLDYLLAVGILKVYPRTIERTPVDTGRARAGWLIGTRSNDYVPSTNEKFEGYKTQALAQGTAQVEKNFKSLMNSDIIFINNNVEYIYALDAGWSKQNSGFIGLLLAELTQTFQELVNVKKGA